GRYFVSSILHAPTHEIYILSLHDALPIFLSRRIVKVITSHDLAHTRAGEGVEAPGFGQRDRKSCPHVGSFSRRNGKGCMDAALGVSVLRNAHRSRPAQRWPGVAGRGPPVQPPGGTG